VAGRSSVAGASGDPPVLPSTAVPHDGQNRASLGTVAPQEGQTPSVTRPKIYPAAVSGRRSRVGRWFERVALGAIMGAVAFVVERRLMKTLNRKGEASDATLKAGELELAPTPEQVDQQTDR
jgi:hypothetical protein